LSHAHVKFGQCTYYAKPHQLSGGDRDMDCYLMHSGGI